MARTVEIAQDGSRTVRFDLKGRQRRSFLVMAAFCLVSGPVVAVTFITGPTYSPGHPLWSAATLTLTFWVIALYYVRVAFGWVIADSTGLRTSRLFRGQSLRWDDIESIRLQSYQAPAGGVTVVKVHAKDGRTFLLPAPRTTRPGTRPATEREFYQALDYLNGALHYPEARRGVPWPDYIYGSSPIYPLDTSPSPPPAPPGSPPWPPPAHPGSPPWPPPAPPDSLWPPSSASSL